MEQNRIHGRSTKLSYRYYKVNIENFIRNGLYRQPASHYYVKRTAYGISYNHHFLLSGYQQTESGEIIITIIHFDGEPTNTANASIREESVTIGLTENGLGVLHAGSESIRESGWALINAHWRLVVSQHYENIDRDHALHNARQRQRHINNYPEYNILTNNCEHFVRLILTGRPESKQVFEMVVAGGVGIILGCFGPAAIMP